ncbi:MAG: DUF5985 family protein [Thermoanaerobaculia bacterium]
MADAVYVLCAVTSTACAVLLLRAYLRSKVRLLLWNGLCFSCLAINNVLLVVDLSILPRIDLSVVRSVPVVVGLSILLYGLIWDSSRRMR